MCCDVDVMSVRGFGVVLVRCDLIIYYIKATMIIYYITHRKAGSFDTEVSAVYPYMYLRCR